MRATAFFFRNFLEKKRFWVDIFGEISVLGESCRKHGRSTSYRGSLNRNRENQDVHQACPFFCGKFHLLIKIFSRFLAEHRSVELWKRKRFLGAKKVCCIREERRTGKTYEKTIKIICWKSGMCMRLQSLPGYQGQS